MFLRTMVRARYGDGAGWQLEDCIRYALSQPLSTLVCGMRSTDEVDQNARIAAGFERTTAEERDAFLERTSGVASDGR